MARAASSFTLEELPQAGALQEALGQLGLAADEQARLAAAVCLNQMARPEVVAHVNRWLRQNGWSGTGVVIAADEKSRIVLDIWPKPTTGLHFVVSRTNPRTGEMEILMHRPLEDPAAPDAPEWMLPRGHLNPLKDASMEEAKARLIWEKTGVALCSDRFRDKTEALLKKANPPLSIDEAEEQGLVSRAHTFENLSTLSGRMKREAKDVVLNGYHVSLDDNPDTLAKDGAPIRKEHFDPRYRWIPVSSLTLGPPQAGQLSLRTLYNSDAVLIESAISRVRDTALTEAEIITTSWKTTEYYELIAEAVERLFDRPSGSILRRHLFEPDNAYLNTIHYIETQLAAARAQLGDAPLVDGKDIETVLTELSGDVPPERGAALRAYAPLWEAFGKIAGYKVSERVESIAASAWPVEEIKRGRDDAGRLQPALDLPVPTPLREAIERLPPDAAALEVLSLLRDPAVITHADQMLRTASPEEQDLLLHDASGEAGRHITLGRWPKPAVGVNMVITRQQDAGGAPEFLFGLKEGNGGNRFVTIGGHHDREHGANLDMTIVAELFEETGLVLLSPRFERHINAYLRDQGSSLAQFERTHPDRISRAHHLDSLSVSETFTRNSSDSITGYWLEMRGKTPLNPVAGSDVNGGLRWAQIADLRLQRPAAENPAPLLKLDDAVIYVSDFDRSYREAIMGTVHRMRWREVSGDAHGKMHSLEFYEKVAKAVEDKHGLPGDSLLRDHLVGPTWNTYTPRVLALAEIIGEYAERRELNHSKLSSGDPELIGMVAMNILSTGGKWRANDWLSSNLKVGRHTAEAADRVPESHER